MSEPYFGPAAAVFGSIHATCLWWSLTTRWKRDIIPPLLTPNRRGHMASHIERRKFLATLGGAAAAAWPLAARAQRPSIPVIGFLDATTAADTVYRVSAFRDGLK